jgi:pyruvate/oxaloacetate carboxyltransferase
MAKKIEVMETVLRDAHQCLLATRMRTEDMLPIAAKLDEIGYWSLETWGGATFDATLRFLKECPWGRLRKLRAAMPKTRFQMLLRGQNIVGYKNYPDDVVQSFVQRAAANGVDVFRIFDAMNDVRNMKTAIDAALKTGKLVEGTVCYTISPVHNADYFLKVADKLADMGVQVMHTNLAWPYFPLGSKGGGLVTSERDAMHKLVRSGHARKMKIVLGLPPFMPAAMGNPSPRNVSSRRWIGAITARVRLMS